MRRAAAARTRVRCEATASWAGRDEMFLAVEFSRFGDQNQASMRSRGQTIATRKNTVSASNVPATITRCVVMKIPLLRSGRMLPGVFLSKHRAMNRISHAGAISMTYSRSPRSSEKCISGYRLAICLINWSHQCPIPDVIICIYWRFQTCTDELSRREPRFASGANTDSHFPVIGQPFRGGSSHSANTVRRTESFAAVRKRLDY